MADLTKLSSSELSSRNYFGKIKLAWKLFGISLRDNDSISYKIYTFMIFILIMAAYLVLDVIEIFTSDADDANSLMLFFFPFFLGFFKASYILMVRTKIGKLLDKLEQEPFTPTADRGNKDWEEKLIQKYVSITNVQAYILYIVPYITILFECLVTISKRMRSSDYHDWEFSYGKFAVLNVTYSPNYEICWAYQTLTIVVIGTHFITADVAVVSILAHICCQFQILQNFIKQIPRISFEEMVKESGCNNSAADSIKHSIRIPWRYLKKSIVNVVNYHLAIIGIADEIEALFKRLCLIIIVITLALLGYLLYNASQVPITDPHVFPAAAEILCGCSQVLLLCYWGEQMSFQSQEVGRAAYETNFVGSDLRFQKSLAFIIHRSQRPVVVTASNFSAIGLPVFIWIIQTSYSAFMMLQNLQN